MVALGRCCNAISVALGCGVVLVTLGVCCGSHMVQMDHINLLQKQYTPAYSSLLHIVLLISLLSHQSIITV